MALEQRVHYLEAQLDGLAQTVAELRKSHDDDDDDDVSCVSLPSTTLQPPSTLITRNRSLQEDNRRLGEENVKLQIKLKQAIRKKEEIKKDAEKPPNQNHVKLIQEEDPEKPQAEKKPAASGLKGKGDDRGGGANHAPKRARKK